MTMELLVSIRMTMEELEKLDRFAKRLHVSRSEAVRRAVLWAISHPEAMS